MAKLLARRAVTARSSSSGVTDAPPPAVPAPRDRVRCANDDAAALIEFALLLPFLTIMVFGMIDLGRAYHYKSRVTNIAREGANYAQYYPRSYSNCGFLSMTIRTRAWNEDRTLFDDAKFGGLTVRAIKDPNNNPITPISITGCTVNATPNLAKYTLHVRASYNFQPLTPIVSALPSVQANGGVITLSGDQEVVVQG